MGVILLPQKHLKQPQYACRLDPLHWLTKDVTFALNGAVPYFNAARGGSAGLSAGGTGFSVRPTPLGRALYTPNGGWADFAIAEDWAGPNTVIALCRVNDMDNPWGGLFSKNTSGTATQFAVGRFSSEDFIYGSVDDSTALKFTGASSVTGLVGGFSTIAFTHSGVTSSNKSYYLNGSLIGSTIGLAAQPSGTGPLGLGRGRDSNATFDSEVDWLGFIRVRRVLSATEIAEVSRNIWAVWKAPARRIWVAGDVSGDTTGSASGTSTASGVGASDNAQPGAASGASTVSGVGASTAESVASSSGASTASGVGQAVIESVGTASGTSTADGVGTSGTGSSGSASGTSSADGVGAAVTTSVGSSDGLALASGVGASVATSTGTSSGTSTVSGVGDSTQPGSAVGTAVGTSTATGAGASVVAAVGSASGDCAVTGQGSSTGGVVESFAGGYPYISRESHAERKKRQRIALGIIEDDGPHLEQFEISELTEKTPVLVPAKKQHIPARQQKKLDQEAINAELKALIQLELDREEETIIRMLMEM